MGKGDSSSDPIRETGMVKWFSKAKGFGFITASNGNDDVFVHQRSILAMGFRYLREGEYVEFVSRTDDDGRRSALEVTTPWGASVGVLWRPPPSHGSGINWETPLENQISKRIARGPRFNRSTIGGTATITLWGRGRGGRSGTVRVMDGTCFNCGQRGHFSRECLNPNPRMCYSCGRSGHISRLCPSEPAEGGHQNKYCYNCGEVGHVIRDCGRRTPTST